MATDNTAFIVYTRVIELNKVEIGNNANSQFPNFNNADGYTIDKATVKVKVLDKDFAVVTAIAFKTS